MGSAVDRAGWEVSVHDVMPGTLAAVHDLLDYLRARAVPPPCLLVVPGCAWTDDERAVLRRWRAEGHALAGHGWVHRVERRVGWYHHLHSRLFSRMVAEHLALDAEGIAALITRCHAWFGAQGLPPPRRYVPPAWAMGDVARARLRGLPFDEYEMLGGVYHAREDRFEASPVIGFEADTGARAAALGAINAVQRWRARGRLRIALHPHDLRLRLRPAIDALFENG